MYKIDRKGGSKNRILGRTLYLCQISITELRSAVVIYIFYFYNLISDDFSLTVYFKMSGEESAAIALLTRAVELDSTNRYTEVFGFIFSKIFYQV